MKKILIISLSFIYFFINTSCTKENDPNAGKPYYKFTQDDVSKLLITFDIGKHYVYKNQDNQEIKFKVITSKTGKISKYPWQGFGPPVNYEPDFFFDEQNIELELSSFPYIHNNCSFNLKRYPNISGNSVFYCTMEFPYWNGYYDEYDYHNTIFINYTEPKISMTINGITYNEVRVINSNKTTALTGFQVPRNVNIIYYDENAGIIGFDDLNGKIWRIK